MTDKKYLTREMALPKIKYYCSYQERCHSEVKEKLYSFGLRTTDVDALISTLIEENYLNEERFAQQFAGGKFRMNHWGRIKITHALQQKRVSTYCIKKGLKEISEDDYEAMLLKLSADKWKTLEGDQHLTRQGKTYAYLLQKGYEPALISKAIADLKQIHKEG